jgi:hypothetical protein
LSKTFWLVLLAEGYARVGQVAEGQQVLAEASALAHTRELRVWEAELNRLWGELLLQQADQERDRSSAETYFRQAFEIAFNQQAKSLELRAAMSLSRLWQQQGKKNAARERLEKSYHWFTEGFDTADLQEAKALLDQLANSHGDQSSLPLGALHNKPRLHNKVGGCTISLSVGAMRIRMVADHCVGSQIGSLHHAIIVHRLDERKNVYWDGSGSETH